MNRPSLRHVLSSALLAALAIPTTACGGVVIVDSKGSDGGEADAANDSTPSDASDDTFTPADTSGCTESPVVDTSTCNESVTYPCGLPIALAGTTPTTTECQVLCDPVVKATGRPTTFFSCWVSGEDGSPSQRVGCATCAVGRRPAGLQDGEEVACADPVADALSEMARIEAASVHAFRRLETALARLDAPSQLRARARSAARDEIRHARIVSRLARERGGARKRVRIERAEVTTFDLALENAVEGCVKETLGVAYLAHQAAHGEDEGLRAMAAALYEDELAHATLSWDLVALFDAHLDSAQKQAVRAAQARALEEVVDEASNLDPTVRRAFGIPSGAVVKRMVEELRGTLYA
ncbi:MAG: ferritin-like domain-containing protein [Polyangiales bacterium]